LIVGVPSEVKSYYYKTPTTTTVANRLDELPEISKLSKEECDELIERGFVEKLRYSVDDLAKFKSHIRWITGGIPQLVHEYCLEVAIIAEDSQHVDPPRDPHSGKRVAKKVTLFCLLRNRITHE
jgi:hypothetical protein